MENAESVAPVPFPGRTPARRERPGGAAWKGAGASLLLHLFVGGAVIVALSGPPRAAPQVIDLTLLPPAETGRRPVPRAFTAAAEPARNPGAAVLPEPAALSALPTHRDRIAEATPISRSDTAEERNTPAAGTEPPRPAAPLSPSTPVGAESGSSLRAAPIARATTGESGGEATPRNPYGKPGVSSPIGDFAYIRDAIQQAIAYPATARRMGWEGKVVVAFHLLPDGSVLDVRVVQGSGHAALDRGAIDAVRSASPFPRSPVEAEVVTPVVYRLTTR